MKEPDKHLLCFQFGYLTDTDEYHILGKTLAQSLFGLQLKLQLDLQHNFEVIVYKRLMWASILHSRSSENCSHMSGSNTFMLKKHTNKYKGGQDLSPWHSLKSMAEKVFKPISWHSTDKHQQLKEPSTNSCIFPKQLPPMKSLHNTLIINATDYKLMFYPRRRNVTTLMVGLKNGHIRKNLTQKWWTPEI